jgi:hypothetical protein
MNCSVMALIIPFANNKRCIMPSRENNPTLRLAVKYKITNVLAIVAQHAFIVHTLKIKIRDHMVSI